jgi:hypothetical protein
MKALPAPALYQINTRVWLTELSRLQNQLEDVGYDRDGSDLQSRGLYLDAPAWQASVFALTRKS